MDRKGINKVFYEEGFRQKYFTRFEVDEGIEDPVTGKKAPWTISWQLDTSATCEYIEVQGEEELRNEIRKTKHQADLEKSKSAYLKSKHMDISNFADRCKGARSDVSILVDAIKELDCESLSVQPDFYEKSMFCIVIGEDVIEGEGDYDERCIAGSIEQSMAEKILNLLQGSQICVTHIESLAKNGLKLIDEHVQLLDKQEEVSEELKKAYETISAHEQENDRLRKKLDKQIASTLMSSSGEGGGNVTVADPVKFAKILRVLEEMHEDLERAKRGDSTSSLPINSGNAISKEVLRFNEMIRRILLSVHGDPK